jgi:sodium-dependent dicarboxylate transporter 2/3/5
MARWGGGQTACAVAFGAAVTLWLFPGFAALLRLPPTHVLAPLANLPESVVAVLVALGLFLWPVGRKRALTWQAASRVDWGTLLLFGGGLSLGKIMFDTGLAEHAGRLVVEATGVDSLWGLTALSIGLAIGLTEVTSNTAAVNMLAPIVIALSAEIGVSPVPPVLAVCFGASMAFMLPISTPPNAIVYGTGLLRLTYMLKMGVLMDATAFVVIFAVLRLLCPILGLA